MLGRKNRKRIITRRIRKKSGLRKNSLIPTSLSAVDTKKSVAPYDDYSDPQIPQRYNETYIRAIPRDPEHLYVYWEISPESQDTIKRTMGEETISSKDTLRLIQLREQCGPKKECSVDEIVIHDQTRNTLVKVPVSDRSYRVEYGITTTNKQFTPVSVSSPAAVPTQTLSAPPPSVKSVDTARITAAIFDRTSTGQSSELTSTIETGSGDFSSDSTFREVKKQQ